MILFFTVGSRESFEVLKALYFEVRYKSLTGKQNQGQYTNFFYIELFIPSWHLAYPRFAYFINAHFLC